MVNNSLAVPTYRVPGTVLSKHFQQIRSLQNGKLRDHHPVFRGEGGKLRLREARQPVRGGHQANETELCCVSR